MRAVLSRVPLFPFGMTSLVLGFVALFVAILPILGIPISLFGLFFGVLGCVTAFFVPNVRLRWSLAGLAIGFLALAVNLAINQAPDTDLPGYRVPKPWLAPPNVPSVPPPAL